MSAVFRHFLFPPVNCSPDGQMWIVVCRALFEEKDTCLKCCWERWRANCCCESSFSMWRSFLFCLSDLSLRTSFFVQLYTYRWYYTQLRIIKKKLLLVKRRVSILHCFPAACVVCLLVLFLEMCLRRGQKCKFSTQLLQVSTGSECIPECCAQCQTLHP